VCDAKTSDEDDAIEKETTSPAKCERRIFALNIDESELERLASSKTKLGG
jgi:hypothetical protein